MSKHDTPADDNIPVANGDKTTGFEESYQAPRTATTQVITTKKRRPRRAGRTVLLVAASAILLAGVSVGVISSQSVADTDSTGTSETKEEAADRAITLAHQKAGVLLDEVGATFFKHLQEEYAATPKVMDTIQSRAQSEGVIVSDDRGDSYVLTGEIAGIPAKFDIPKSVKFFSDPMEEDPLWTVQALKADVVSAVIPPENEFVQAVKFHGVALNDGTPTAITIVYSTAKDGTVYVTVLTSVLIMDDATTKDKLTEQQKQNGSGATEEDVENPLKDMKSADGE